MGGRCDRQTVVFADVVGSTRLGERLDAETLHDVLADVISAVVLAIEAHGGVVKDIAGDGVLAVFDDPTAAIKAAATIVSVMEEVKEEIRAVHGLDPPEVRVGAHHGLVRRMDLVAGSRRDVRIAGPAVEGAVALEAAARPGTVLVNAALASLAGGDATLVDPGSGQAVQLAGFAAPLPSLGELRGRQVSACDAQPDEQRPIVALFAAIVSGSGGELDDEVVVAALDAAASSVERFGGHIKDMAGDVVVAVFGAPSAHEDDVDRALRAAADCVERVEAATRGVAAARCGVATGRAIVGSVGAGDRREYGAVGDAMNTAARVQAQSAAGVVLATADVRRRSSSSVIWGSRRDLTAKGKADPIIVYEVVNAGAAEAVSSADLRLVGRDEELADLVARLRDGRSVVVIGDAGCGKSALVSAASHHVGGRWLCFRPRSWERVEHLRTVSGLVGADVPPGARQEMVSAADRLLREALADAASDAPVFVRVDDLQYADAASVEVLARLAADPPPGVCVVAAGRSGAAAVDVMLGSAEEVIVEPLGADAARDLLAAAIGRDALPYDLEARLLATAAGNPLFLEQQVRALVESGVLVRGDDGRWRHGGGAVPALPETLERVVLARLDAIGADCRGLANAAAVLRDHASLAVLTAMCGPTAAETAARLVAAGVLVRVAHGLEFAEPVVREVLEAGLLRKERQRLHHAAAVALGSESPAAWVARHWAEAGASALAAEPARSAALDAEDRASYEEAAEMWELVAAADLDPREGAALALRIGQARHAAGQLEAALDWCGRAADLALAGGLSAVAVAAAVEYEDVFFATRRRRVPGGDRSVELLERATRARCDPPGHPARAYAALGRAVGYSGDGDRARSLTDRAVALARRCGDPSELAYALLAWRTAREAPAALSARLANGPELVDAAVRAGDLALEVEARRLVFMDQLTAGAVAEAFAELPALVDRVEALRQLRYAWYPPMWRGMEALAAGDLDAAETWVARLRDAGRRSRYADLPPVYAMQRFLLWRARREAELPDDLTEAFLAAAGVASERWTVFWAAVAAATCDRRAARRHLDAVLADLSVLGGERIRPAAIALLTEAVELLGDHRAAAVLHAELLPWQGQFALVGSGAALLGPVDHHLRRLGALVPDPVAGPVTDF